MFQRTLQHGVEVMAEGFVAEVGADVDELHGEPGEKRHCPRVAQNGKSVDRRGHGAPCSPAAPPMCYLCAFAVWLRGEGTVEDAVYLAVVIHERGDVCRQS